MSPDFDEEAKRRALAQLAGGYDPMDNVLALADRPELPGPIADIRQPGPAMSDVMPMQAAEQAQPPPKDRGFDWARAFYAAGGGNPQDIENIRAARHKLEQSEINEPLLREERKKKLQELLEGAKNKRGTEMAKLQALLNNSRARQELDQKRLDQRQGDIDADNARADKALAAKTKPRAAGGAGTSKEEAKRISLQIKSMDKKAIEELQNIGTADAMLAEAEKILPEAYTGPGAGALVKGNDALKAVGLGGVVPDSISKKLNNTQKLGADFEQAVADMRKGRFGSSFTEGEKKAFQEWAPGKQLSSEGNKNLMSAARKYFSMRGQERLGQLLQEVGIPFYLPPDAIMDLGDVKKVRSLFNSMNFYDSGQSADTIDAVNSVLGKYGGRISGAPSKAIAAQVSKGAPQTPSTAAGAAEQPPSRPGAVVGEKLRNKRTGTTWVWNGSAWSK